MMDYKKAATILISLLKKHSLDAEEKESVETAIGVLVWAALSKNSIKKLKDKKDKSTE
ncbi:MAG: hypothetical protein PHW95_02465 [Patescibacteria group bacterium]|nr:hypothetical protein [Patescibacteria group bacterium]